MDYLDNMGLIPSFSSYGEYSSGNYGANAMKFTLPMIGISFYYSYQTLIAFTSSYSGLVVRENAWSTTTGKHLNWIDGGNKDDRVNGANFIVKLKETLSHYNLVKEI